MRTTPLVVVSLVMGSGSAAAEAVSAAFSVRGHASRLAGQAESGGAAAVELALGSGRWQSFGEASLGTSSVVEWLRPAPSGDHRHHTGMLARGAAGLRYVARQLAPTPHTAIELIFVSAVGLQHYRFDDAMLGTVTRPELSAGVGIQGRWSRPRRVGFRIELRGVRSPGPRAANGFALGVGYVW